MNKKVMSSKRPMGHGSGAKDAKRAIKTLIKYLSPYKISFAIVFVFAILSTIFAIVGPKILGDATTEIFNGLISKVLGTGNGMNFDAIARIALLLLILYVVSSIFMYIFSYIMARVTMKVTYKLRRDISHKLNLIPLDYFEKVNHGEILSRVTNDVDTLTMSLNQGLTQALTSITTIIGIVVMMFSISWLLSVVAICIVPISFIVTAIVITKSQKHFRNQQEYLGHLDGQVEEMFGGHTVVKAFNRQEESLKEFDEYNEVLYRSAWKSQFYSGVMMPIMNTVSNIGYVLVCIIGGYLTTQGSMTIGGMMSFMQYVRQFTQPFTQLAEIANVFQQSIAASERVFDFLAEEEEIPEEEKPLIFTNEEKQAGKDYAYNSGSVQFNNVNFGYKKDNIVINDFSAEAKPRQKIAIVGPTGAGKSTMIKLLMRFYDVNSGSIEINNHNIKSFKRGDLRAQFGMVLQDTWLFYGTIMENIRYGNFDASDEDVYRAAKLAQADHFINTLPDGYNTILDEEITNVSQGQKQLLTIARAILNNPKILILDEATSSVDTRTEKLISKAMDDMMKGRTSFVIAHRLSTIIDADLILVMDNGNVIEQGTHDELMQKGGFYASLYNSQFTAIASA